MSYSKIIETDVAVLGGAGSGLCAALRAAESGARVVILEKMKRLGGSTVLAAGFFGVGSPAQQRLGIFSTPDECYREVMQLLYWNVDARLVRNWMQQSGESIRWLEEKGIIFDQVVPFQAIGSHAKATYHVSNGENMRTGMQIYKKLEGHILNRDDIDVYLNTKALRLIIIIAATIVTAASVSVTGMIGWVGLVIPHLSRMLIGSDYRKLMPASMLMGACFLLLVDDVSRLATTAEIPIGILTAFIGAPFFLYLITREGKKR